MTTSSKPFKLYHIFVLAFAVLLTVFMSVFRHDLVRLSRYGYAGIFIACFAANSTVFLPAPSSTIVLIAAGLYSPLHVGIIGGLGASAGEVLGYSAGFSGREVVARSALDQQVQEYVGRYGIWAVLVFAFVPLPLFDLVGVTAGALHMSFPRFLLPCLIGKTLKMLAYAYVGAETLPVIMSHIERFLSQLLR